MNLPMKRRSFINSSIAGTLGVVSLSSFNSIPLFGQQNIKITIRRIPSNSHCVCFHVTTHREQFCYSDKNISALVANIMI